MATRFKSVIAFLATVMVVATAACAGDPASDIDATIEAGIAATMVGVAIEKGVKATMAAPSLVEDHFDSGTTYFIHGEYENAIKEYDKAIQLDPDFASAYNNRRNVYRKLGQHEKADADKAKACSLANYYC